MKERIMAAMNERISGVSFVELSRYVEGFNGNYEMLLASNIVVWSGMSEAAIDALYELRDEELIHFWPSSLLVYIIDGLTLTYPIAKRPTPKGYKVPHWLPSVVNLGPAPAKYRRKK